MLIIVLCLTFLALIIILQACLTNLVALQGKNYQGIMPKVSKTILMGICTLIP